MIIFSKNISALSFTKETLKYNIGNLLKFLRAVFPLILAFSLGEYLLFSIGGELIGINIETLIKLLSTLMGFVFFFTRAIEGSLQENWKPKNYGFSWASQHTRLLGLCLKLLVFWLLLFFVKYILNLLYIYPFFFKFVFPIANHSKEIYFVYIFLIVTNLLSSFAAFILYVVTWPALATCALGKKMTLRTAWGITKKYLFKFIMMLSIPLLLPTLFKEIYYELQVDSFLYLLPLDALSTHLLSLCVSLLSWSIWAVYIWSIAIPIVFLHKVYLTSKDKELLDALREKAKE